MSINTNAYNHEQALNPAASVFVSANAGAGKTSLLTSRVLSLLLHGAMPSKIICLTFTNAAAAEMANRIQSELGSWVMMEDEKLQITLTRLLGTSASAPMMKRARSLFAHVLEAPDGIRIQTIHGFCQSLLRRFPVEAGINPHFTVMDSRTEQELLREAELRLFSRANDADPLLQDALAAMARSLGEQAFHSLVREIIQHKRKFLSLFARPHDIGHTLYRVLGINKNTSRESLLAEHFSYSAEQLTSLRAAGTQLLFSEKSSDQKTGQGIAAWLEKKDAMSYIRVFVTEKGSKRKTLHTKDALSNPDHAELLLQEQERVWRYSEANRVLAIAEATSHLLHFAEGLLSLYAQLKFSQALMDYDDLILTACDLLQKPGISPWVLYKLDGGIDHLLIDEAQDTSPEQWIIANALTQDFFAGNERNRSLFIVGDEKQSIYSFQGADPYALGKMQSYFASRITAADYPLHRINLHYSFRSTPEVLSVVDAIFAHAKAREGLMFSDSALSHIPTRTESNGVVELWPLTHAQNTDELFLSPHTLLARRIAARIRDWIDRDGVTAGDIMILVRSRTTLVDRLVRALKKQDIPVAGHDRMVLSDTLVAQDLIALGQCVLLPEDDLSLAALLKSPLFNLSEEQLFTLAHNRGKRSLWERLSEYSRTDAAFADAFALLTDLRARADFISPFEFYSYALDTLPGRRKIIGRMGSEHNDPIDEFLGQALVYERAHTASLQGFLHWMHASDSEIKRDMEQSKNCVRIMTVHGAKGLQAPIVILPDTIELPKQKNTLQWHESNTTSMPLWGMSADTDTALTASLRNSGRQAMLAEYRRLLYVALTRAEDRLYICGATSKETISEDCWYQLVKDGMAAIATPFETPWGEGLRVGRHLERREVPPLTKGNPSALPQDNKSWDFLHKPVPSEPAVPKPLTPSRLRHGEPTAVSPLNRKASFLRGNFIHRLLQYLPDGKPDQWQQAAQAIAAGFRQTMSQSEIDECIAEVIAILNDANFAFFFGADSLAEVPVAGCVTAAGHVIAVAGQIDRLWVGESEVWIIDFKSNAAAPGAHQPIPGAYLEQMQLYRLLLQNIYPAKKIQCALLWTRTAAITVIPESLLDETHIATYI